MVISKLKLFFLRFRHRKDRRLKCFGEFWVDDNFNRWSTTIFTFERAAELSAAGVGNFGCIDCVDCTNCK